MYVIGMSRDGHGAIVKWVQKVETTEQAKEVSENWQAAGIINVEIIKA